MPIHPSQSRVARQTHILSLGTMKEMAKKLIEKYEDLESELGNRKEAPRSDRRTANFDGADGSVGLP